MASVHSFAYSCRSICETIIQEEPMPFLADFGWTALCPHSDIDLEKIISVNEMLPGTNTDGANVDI